MSKRFLLLLSIVFKAGVLLALSGCTASDPETSGHSWSQRQSWENNPFAIPVGSSAPKSSPSWKAGLGEPNPAPIPAGSHAVC